MKCHWLEVAGWLGVCHICVLCWNQWCSPQGQALASRHVEAKFYGLGLEGPGLGLGLGTCGLGLGLIGPGLGLGLEGWGLRLEILALTTSLVETPKDVAVECKWETVPKLSNGATSNDLEWPLRYILIFQQLTELRGLCNNCSSSSFY